MPSISAILQNDISSCTAVMKGLQLCTPYVRESNYRALKSVLVNALELEDVAASLTFVKKLQQYDYRVWDTIQHELGRYLESAVVDQASYSCMHLVKGLSACDAGVKAINIRFLMGTSTLPVEKYDAMLEFVQMWLKNGGSIPVHLSKGKVIENLNLNQQHN